MAIHLLLLFAGREAPPNWQLDGAIVVVWEVSYGVAVSVPARQVAVVENDQQSVYVDEAPPIPAVVVGAVSPHIVEVTEVAPAIVAILEPKIPKAVVTENTSAAETR